MHPELLRALARARHNDLLGIHQTRGRTDRRFARIPRFARSRERLGYVLIGAGARLMGDHRSALELAQK